MNIVIDTRWIFRELSGIGVYTVELVRHLPRLNPDDRYFLIFNDAEVRERTERDTGVGGMSQVRWIHFPYGVFSPLSQVFLPGVCRRVQADVFHSTNYMIPVLAFPPGRPHRTACVITIHDVIPLVVPHYAPRSRKARILPLYRRLMTSIGRRADAILADSNHSRQDVIRALRLAGDDASKVHTVYCGVSGRYAPATVSKDPDPRRTRTILYVGRMDPYKNLTTLVQAFARVHGTLPFPVRLAIVGSPDPRYPEAVRLAHRLGIESSVSWSGYTSDEGLVSAYRAADLLVHPSHYEGFGLQVAEAMACGIPVVSSNAASLPEVAGDAALLVPPEDVAGFADAIRRVLTDPSLASDLVRKGIRQAARFTWEQTARRVLDVYRKVAGG